MADFADTDLTGSQFERVDLSAAAFRMTHFNGAKFRNVDFSDVVMQDVDLINVRITGAIENVTINDVEIAPLVNAELDRRDPDRVKMRPTDAAGCREAWDTVERIWAATVARARSLDPAMLHQSVDGEWSFIETLRHLTFATDAWVRRGILGDPAPWHPLGLPWDQMPDTPGVPRDRDARPTLDEVLKLRLDRMATVRDYVDALTDETLAGDTVPVEGPGWPPARSFPILECLRIVFNEEWEHRRFAERDLSELAGPIAPCGVSGHR